MSVTGNSIVRCMFSLTLGQLREPSEEECVELMRRRNEQTTVAGCFETLNFSDALGMELQKVLQVTRAGLLGLAEKWVRLDHATDGW